MKFLDFLIGLLIFWGAYNGYQKGIVKQLASLLGIIAGIFLAKNFYPNLDLKLQKTFESEAGFISIISLISIFLITVLTFNIIAKILTKFLKKIALGVLNKIFGTVFGATKSILILCVIVFVFSKINNLVGIIKNEELHQSTFYSNIEKINDIIIKSSYEEKGNEE